MCLFSRSSDASINFFGFGGSEQGVEENILGSWGRKVQGAKLPL